MHPRLLFQQRAASRFVLGFLFLLIVAGFWWLAQCASVFGFLPARTPAEWIVYDRPPEGGTHPEVEMQTVFRRKFTLGPVPSEALVSIMSFREHRLTINGTACATLSQSARNWKHPQRFSVVRYLKPGQNEIEVTVANKAGPPALWFSLRGDGILLTSDTAWSASLAGAVEKKAALASSAPRRLAGGKIHPHPSILESLTRSWRPLLVFVLFAAAIASALTSTRLLRLLSSFGPRLPQIGLVAILLFWLILVLRASAIVPAVNGYDADAHIHCIKYIQTYRSLPRANEGWETFQPPLYYATAAGVLNAFSLPVDSPSGVLALRSINVLAMLGTLLLALAGLRIVFPQNNGAVCYAFILACCILPVTFLSVYTSNEAFTAALVTLALYITLRTLRAGKLSFGASVAIGVCLGAALLAKLTAAVVIVPVLAVLVYRFAATRESVKWLLPARLGVLMLTAALVSGWYYFRLWQNFGTPFAGNWDPQIASPWWQDPGFRTGSYYCRFGHALVNPIFSSVESFWDGLYSTLWGDGLRGGSANTRLGSPWNYDLMNVGYWLAIVPTLIVLLGTLRLLWRSPTERNYPHVLLLGFASLMLCALIFMSLKIPSYAQVKAFYGTSALLPLIVFGAAGFQLLSIRGPVIRFLLTFSLSLWAINSLASLWIIQSSDANLVAQTEACRMAGDYQQAIALLRQSLSRDQANVHARVMLADLLNQNGEPAEAVREALQALAKAPESPEAHLALANGYLLQEKPIEALEHASFAANRAPGDARAFDRWQLALAAVGRMNDAITVCREGLGVSPFDPHLRLALGEALARRRDKEALEHLKIVIALRPDWKNDAQQLMRLALATNEPPNPD